MEHGRTGRGIGVGFRAGLGLTLLLAAGPSASHAVNLSISPPAAEYAESLETFPNPERGWFWPFNPYCCSTNQPHRPLDVGFLKRLRERPEAITLIRDGVQLGQHMHGPISQESLNRIQADWDATRQAGVKVIVRFLYDWSLNNRDPEESVIDTHLEQLGPLLRANEDVIAMVEAGLFGGSGEANKSNQGYVYSDPNSGGWQRLSPAGIRIYRKLLTVIPPPRQMLVRYPRFKWDLLGWNSSTALPGADRRIGYYDDGWLGDDNHFAFFQLPNERRFTEQDSRHVIVGGEPSMRTATNQDAAAALREMIKLHQTTLNRNSNDASSMYDRWRLSPQWGDITRRMGYRIVLQKVSFDSVAEDATQVKFTVQLVNRGFASLANPRPSVLILRNRATGAMTRLPLRLDLRQVAPNSESVLTVSENVRLPQEPAGYDAGLHFPDASPSIAHRVEYAVRLATDGVWEARSGIHWLGIRMELK